MKSKRLFNFITAILMVFSFCTILTANISVPIEVSASGVDNIAARADYLYNTTWTAQATVKGWRNSYTFSKGSTYHIPYGQPVTKGKYICWGVSVDNFISATKNASGEFYSTRSYYSGNSGSYSTYYAMDCSALASYCWGLSSRTTTSSWSSLPVTNYGKCTSANVNEIQIGDALNLAGSHIVIVSDVSYDSNGNVTTVEITEQTPPETKRSYYTASELVSKYSSYTIYRYNKRNDVTPPPNVPKNEIITPTISTDKSSYNIGDTVNISWAASPSNSNLSHYWLNVIAPDGTWIYGGTMNKETSYSFVASQTGNYSVTTYATPIGSKEGEGSLTDTKTVNVTEANWYGNLSAVDVGDSFYAYIINVVPWKHLTNNNGNVEISAETAATSQIWRFSRNSDGSYKIVNCADGNCLDVYGAYSDSGTNIQTYPAHDDTSAQKWFIYGASGEYIFRAGCTDCVLDVNGGLRDDGTNVQMWTKNDSSAQIFQIWKLMPELSVETGNKAKLTNFTWTNFPGTDRTYDLKIWKGTLWEGDAYQIDWSLKDNDQKIDLPVGHYEAYIDTRVGTEQLMSNVVKFDITEDYFGQSELKVVAGDKYSKTYFKWTPVEKAEFYDLKIWNGTVWEGDAYQIEWNIKDTSIDLALPAGYYEAYIDARDANHMQMSNVVKFAVKRDYQVIEGDANDDGKVTVADAVMLQKWLLGSVELTCWQNVDLCKDNRIDVFDLCLMKRMLIENSGVVF